MTRHSQSSAARQRRALLRPLTSALLILTIACASVPVAVAREATPRTASLIDDVGSISSGWLAKLKSAPKKRKGGTQQDRPIGTGTKPQPPPTKSQREARVSSIRVSPKDDITLESGKSVLFLALPLDRDGAAVQGLACGLMTSNSEVLAISKTGEATGGKPGQATITATAGQITQTKVVTVVEATSGKFGPTKQKSTRHKSGGNYDSSSRSSSTSSARSASEHHHARNSFASPLQDIAIDPLPDDETDSLYNTGNLIGSPPGKKKPGALTPPVSTGGTETGNQNFSFALPVVGMSGRGVGVSLSLVYNSQLWNKSVDPGNSWTWMTYDVDSGWPAPGFRLSFGQIEDQGDSFTLTDPDGTRHALTLTSTDNYDSTDGTFIHYNGGGTSSGTLYYPDGTVVTYGAGGGYWRLYPTKITDRNGNYIEIAYNGTSGAGPQILQIDDTLNRHICFHYDASNGDLVTITLPGLTGHDPLQVMRFYYDDVTIPSSGLFDSSIHIDGVPSTPSTPNTLHTLKYVYLPTSSDGSSPIYTGYKFDYSSYGMIYQTTQLHGMTVSSDSTGSAGSVTNEGTSAAQTTYNYPTTGGSLTDAPSYSTRTDEWAGRTSGGSAPYYTFANSTGTDEKISTVTAPDGTITETHAIDRPSSWDDGLISDTYVQYGSTPTILTHTHLDWAHDSANLNQRVWQIRTTDVPGGLTKATVLSYTSYNNVSVVSERDFSTDGSVSATELRKTVTSYITDSNYINRHILHLPETVKIQPGGSTTVLARADYAYDAYGSSHGDMAARSDIIMHDPAFDPFGSGYVSATDYRGNLTSVTTYSDAATPLGSITHSTTYDIAGNVITAQVDCCQLKSFTYSGAGTSGDYAYPISVTSGNPSGLHLTTSATFDNDTGLPATSTDENSQETDYAYNLGSLRLSEVDSPGGGQTTYGYSDGLGVYAYVIAVTKLDSRNVSGYRFFDGRGVVVRSFGNYTSTNGYVTQDIQYDDMGRAYRASNPYYASSLGSSVNPDGFWTTSTFDHLGRVTQVDMPRGDNDNTLTTSVTTSFDGVYTTVTDQASKTRRQKVDALGRVIRLDEPTSAGLGSTTPPNQPTYYEYDLLDNLVHINQGSQDRYFKYDSLSRLIRENQSEQETNSSYDLRDSWNSAGTWTRKIEYNSSGLVTNGYDARGVHTTLSYDGLNRVTQISYSDSTPTAHYYYDDATGLPSGAPGSSSPDSFSTTLSKGRLVGMTYGSGAAGNYFDYDVMGRVTKQFQITGSGPTKYKLTYGYNYAGLLTNEVYPSGRSMTYAYDDGGRLSSVGDDSTTFAGSFNYSAHGGLTSETFGNTAVHELSYNRRLQASQVKLSLGSTVLQQYDYGYGEFNTSSGSIDTSKNNGQIGKVTGTIGTTAQWNQGFSYDEPGRLANVTEHASSAMTTVNYSQSYTYDRYGNRFQTANSTLGLQTVSSTEIVASTNRFIATGSTPTTYDEAGNITTDTKFRSLKYFYDANGRQNEVKALDDTSLQTSVYDCAGQRVQTTAGSVTRTMVYDVFGQNVADYLGTGGATLERENIYRGGQLLATDETPLAAAPSGLTSATASSTSIALSWTAASGASNYRVERKGASGSYALLGTTPSSSTSITDSGASSGTAYLYKVCAADSSGACVSNYSNVALGTTVSFATDPTIYTEAENPGNGTTIKHEHITQLRAAVNAVRTLAGLSTISTPNPATGDVIHATDVSDLRSGLHAALSALGLYDGTYTDPTLATGSGGTIIKKAHITELRQHATSSSSNSKSITQFVTDAYQGVLHGTHPTSGELSSGVSSLTAAQAQGPAAFEAAAQSLITGIFTSSDYTGLGTSPAQFVSDLYTGFLQRAPDDSGYAYWLDQLTNHGDTRSNQISSFGGCDEFIANVAALALAGSSNSLRYVLSDVQGSTRAVINNNSSSSAILARRDYLPFGEEIGPGIGSRTLAQSYNASDNNRWKYGMTERDATSGLDHTWFRKYESLSGRWTSSDPINGAASDPQSFNHFSYAANDPVNFVDPEGLDSHGPGLPGLRPPAPPLRFLDPSQTAMTFNVTVPITGGFGSEGMMTELPSDPQNPGGGGGRVSSPETYKDAAFSDAANVLRNNKECAAFFGVTDKGSLRRVLSTLKSIERRSSIDQTYVYATAKTEGRGRLAHVTLGRAFFYDAAIRVNVIASPTDPSEFRAHTILHEFAHALNVIPDDPGLDQGITNNKTITEHCGKGLSALATSGEHH